MLKRYYQGLGFDQSVAEVWVALSTSGDFGLARRDVVEIISPSLHDNALFATLVDRVRCSRLFDVEYYCDRAGLNCSDLDAAIHYLLVGGPLGLSPSLIFDPEYYGRRNLDVIDAGINCLLHYIEYGREEGRPTLPPTVSVHARLELMDPQRENVIVTVHETSRTGAPILGWNIALRLAERYNVYTIRLGDGALTPQFEALSVEVYGPFNRARLHPLDVELGLWPLFARRVFKYAIINSIEFAATHRSLRAAFCADAPADA